MPEGWVAPAYARVAAVFDEVLPADGPGGAFAATVRGEAVVDLWAGTARDDGRPWVADTPCVVFSGTKGVVATAMLLLVDRGRIALDEPVASVWPAFGAAGKGRVTVGQVLAHTAGLPAIRVPVGRDAWTDPTLLHDLLAAQAPLVPIGAPVYHALTFGWLCDAIAGRVDGRTLGRIVAEDLARPLGLELWIGTPDQVVARAAHPRRAADFALAAHLGPQPPDPLVELVYGNPPVAGADWTDPRMLTVEIPGANGVATARALARLYGCLARGGTLDGVQLLRPETLAAARRERSRGDDALSGRPLRFGAGYELAGTPSELGPAADAFGHTGSGGSSHGAWPGLQVGFSFVMRELRPETTDDRARRLLAALYDAVRADQAASSPSSASA